MKLQCKTVGLELKHPWKIARTERTSAIDVVVVELLGSDGRVGLGEAAPVSRYGESVESVQRFLNSLNSVLLPPSLPSEASIENVRDELNLLLPKSTGHSAAQCAFEIAWLDLFATNCNITIYDLLQLGFREGHHVTSFTIGIDDPSVIKTKVLAAKEFPILKMKVGVPGDRENLNALRGVAPDKWVRVDANEGWKTKEQALEMIQWLADDSKIQFVEQPLPASAPVSDWIWLKQRSPLPIFGDESYHTAADAPLAAECFHGVNVKLVKTGGILGAFDALKAARARGLKTMLGCMIETSVLISAAAHLAELCDYLDLDGNLLISNDPFRGVTVQKGVLSFAHAPKPSGLRVAPASL